MSGRMLTDYTVKATARFIPGFMMLYLILLMRYAMCSKLRLSMPVWMRFSILVRHNVRAVREGIRRNCLQVRYVQYTII